jgi:LCP family protein required for cell wall assembly
MKRYLDSFRNFVKNIKLPAGLKLPDNLKRPSRKQLIFWGAAFLIALGLFVFSRSILACWTVTRLPGVPPAGCAGAGSDAIGTPVVNEQGTPVVAPPTPIVAPESLLPPAWDGASRVNILFIGMDERDLVTNEGPPRSDTMILFTIDPQSKTAGMLSIPRDLWVNIPGFGYSRINTAYPSGEGNQLPGGGPGLAMKTVEQLIGVPVHYFGQIDFSSFEEVIDTIGGLHICIPERIRIDPIGPKPPTNLHAGCQTLHGYEVLSYARQRHTANGDVDRANRQQLVILALRDQIFAPSNFPNMIALAPEVYQEASAGLRTNLSFEDMIKLGVLMQQIPVENIKRGVIDYSMGILDNVTLAGQDASILKPIPDKIRVLRDEIFLTGGPVSPLATGDPTVLMQADGARVRVLNGSVAGDLGQRTGAYLQSQGMAITEIGNADGGYNRTVIVMYGPKLYTLKYLINLFGVNTNSQIVYSPNPASTVDVEIRLGNDVTGIIP